MTIFRAILSMIVVIALSNFLVQFPINDWLTWGAFSYPFSFLVTELTNRYYGPQKARFVVYIGFLFGVIVSFVLATPRIAVASGTAFLTAQLLDIVLFNRWRQMGWWQAPLFASMAASFVDTFVFWGIAFGDGSSPWFTWSIGDFLVKIVVDIALLYPFRLVINRYRLSTTSS
jgi:hypothetical protein